MAKSSAAKRAKSVKAARGGKKANKGVKVSVPTRQLSVERRRGGTAKVVVQTRLAVPEPVKPAAPPARPLKLPGPPLEVSRRFFELHGLPALAQALPPTALIDELVPRARAEGLDRVLIFPPVSAQRAAAELMVVQLLRAPSPALEPSQQYALPWLYDLRELVAAEVRGRPLGPYALAIADAAFPDDTRDRKALQLESRFQALGHSSLTVFEYLVLQRLFAEERQDHRFDQLFEAHGHPPGWQWLLDSKSAHGALHAGWNAARRRVEIGTAPVANFNARRGAHLTLMKPL